MTFQKSGPGKAPRSTQVETMKSGLTEEKRIKPENTSQQHELNPRSYRISKQELNREMSRPDFYTCQLLTDV